MEAKVYWDENWGNIVKQADHLEALHQRDADHATLSLLAGRMAEALRSLDAHLDFAELITDRVAITFNNASGINAAME